MPRRLDYPTYLEHLADDSARFAQVLRRTPYETAVPTCPDWTAADLFFHLAEVQAFWARIVGRRLTSAEEAEELVTIRPEADDELPGLFAEWTQALQEALRATPPDTEVWSWAGEQTAGFSYRRQAHEALIHRLDAELTAEDRTPIDPALAADGVDEVLGVMYGEPPPWGTFTPDHDHVVRFTATDTGDEWSVTIGRFVGRDPGDGAERRVGLPGLGGSRRDPDGHRQRDGRRPGLLAVAAPAGSARSPPPAAPRPWPGWPR